MKFSYLFTFNVFFASHVVPLLRWKEDVHVKQDFIKIAQEFINGSLVVLFMRLPGSAHALPVHELPRHDAPRLNVLHQVLVNAGCMPVSSLLYSIFKVRLKKSWGEFIKESSWCCKPAATYRMAKVFTSN